MSLSGPMNASLPPGEIRVLRLFSRLNIGGPSLHVILLCAGLEARGYRSLLVVGREAAREGNLFELAAAHGVRWRQIDALGRPIRPLRDLRALWSLLRVIRQYRPHIVHTHTAKAGVLGRLAARLAGVPIVVHTYHGHVLSGYFGRWRSEIFRRLEAALARWSTLLLTVSRSVEQDLLARGIAEQGHLRVVPLGLELERLSGELPRGGLRRQAGFPERAPLVGIVGRLVPIKDVATFLRAARRVRESLPPVVFSIVGDGKERPALEGLARELGLERAVCFHGWRRDMAEVYGDLDAVVNSSRNEGTPVALIEALAAGRPVVATAVGGTPDLLGGGERGLLVPPGDPEALARAMLAVLAGGQDCARRAAAGREHALARHSAARLVDDVDALYRELLGTRVGRPAPVRVA